MLSPTFYHNCVLRHQRSVFCFQPHFPASPRRAALEGHELAVSSTDKGIVTLSRPVQPWGPLVASFNPGHGVWWPCPGPARRDEQQEGMLPALCQGDG